MSGGGWRTRWLIRVPHTLAPNNAPLCQSIVRYVAVSYQSARPAGYHPPLPWSPFFQGKRAFLRCTAHFLHPCKRATSLHYLKPPSMWKEGDRLRWRIENSLAHESTPHTRSHLWHCTANQLRAYVAVLCQSARLAGYHPPLPWSPLFQRKRALLRYTAHFLHLYAKPTSKHEPKPLSMWKEGDRLRWRIENSLSHKSTQHTRTQ